MKGFLQICLLVFMPYCFAKTPIHHAVASSHPLATQAGIEILNQGGNAFDAAVAIAGVLAVVEPYHSGLGGSGIWLLHDARAINVHDVVIDATVVAPLASKSENASNSLRSAAIPGEAAGLAYLALNYGKLSLNITLKPAIKLAQEGFELDEQFIHYIQENQDLLLQFPSTKALLLKEDKVPSKGTLLKQPDLAKTLSTLAHQGHSGFYTGVIAKQFVSELKKEEGVWALQDLNTYQVVISRPLIGKYHDTKIITASLPSTGGIELLTALNILADFKLTDLSDADQKHLISESLHRAECDRLIYGNVLDITAINVPLFTSKEHAEQLRETIKINEATPTSHLDCEQSPKKNTHTTHYSVLDKQGNRVAATLTLHQAFGSGYIVGGTGVFLNSGMKDFNPDSKPLSGKKPLSHLAPTFIEMPEGVGILGSSGGNKIPAVIMLSILTAIDDYYPTTWMLTPRYYPSFSPDVIEFETGAFNRPLQNALRLRGHQLKQVSPFGEVQAIFWDTENNKVYAASDPRGKGLAITHPVP